MLSPGLQQVLFGSTFYPGATVALDFLAQRYRAPGVGNFVGAFSALPGLTVTRASTGYAANSDGSLVLFPAGVARITTQGLLVEEARTNLALWSQDFTNAAWTKGGVATVTAAAGIAPDGTNTAQRLQATAQAQANVVLQQVISAAASQTHTVSVWVRATSGTAKLALKLTQASVLDHFSPDITATTDWQRVTFSQAFGAGGTGSAVIGVVGDAAGDAFDVLIWGYQGETNSSFATSYIPTASASATRALDGDKLAVTNPTGNYRVSVNLTTTRATASTRTLFDWNDGTDNNKVLLQMDSTNHLVLSVINGGVTTPIATEGGSPAAARTATALVTLSGGNWSLAVNGVNVATVAASSPVVTSLQIGENRATTAAMNDDLINLIVYPS